MGGMNAKIDLLWRKQWNLLGLLGQEWIWVIEGGTKWMENNYAIQNATKLTICGAFKLSWKMPSLINSIHQNQWN
jgi:hypothetical protein